MRVSLFRLATGLVLLALSMVAPGSTADTSAKERRKGRVELDATLLAFSKHSGIGCGILFIHQVARYRVDRLISGRYAGVEIVVDHPACDGDVFKAIDVGSHVRLNVRVIQGYGVITCSPGIRETADGVDLFYVAERLPIPLGSGESAVSLGGGSPTSACSGARAAGLRLLPLMPSRAPADA